MSGGGSATIAWMSTCGILLGQLLAVSDSLGGAAMEALGNRNLPIAQVAICYGLLFVVNGFIMILSGMRLHARWYVFMLIALVDTIATYATVHALEFTSVTSMGVLSCTGVIVSIPLVYCILRARFNLWHLVGVGLSLAGIVLLVLSDKRADSVRPHIVWGDFLLVLGSSLYAVNSVAIEKTLKGSVPFSELLCLMSGFGFLFSSVALVLAGEHKHITAPSSGVGLLRLGAILAQFATYSLMPAIVTMSGSTIIQLSFLSTAIWSVPVRIILLDGFGSEWWIFLISAVMTVAGILLYISGGNVYESSSNMRLQKELDEGNELNPCIPSQQPVPL